jgi:hypothetical protein
MTVLPVFVSKTSSDLVANEPIFKDAFTNVVIVSHTMHGTPEVILFVIVLFLKQGWPGWS